MYKLSDRQFFVYQTMLFWCTMFSHFENKLYTEILNPVLSDYYSEFPF